MTDLSPLIERLRKAKGPDRELDEAIAVYLAAPHPSLGKPIGVIDSPRYTESIDAAMSLVPEGCGVILATFRGNAKATVSVGYLGEMETKWVGDSGPAVEGRIPALALCIAALSAIQGMKGGSP